MKLMLASKTDISHDCCSVLVIFFSKKREGFLSRKCAKYICPFILSWSNVHSKFIYHMYYIWNFYISPKMIWNLDIFSLFIECYIAVNLYHKITLVGRTINWDLVGCTKKIWVRFQWVWTSWLLNEAISKSLKS